MLVLGTLVPVVAMAQTYQAATMPVLYNSSGQAVNIGNTTALAAGYYSLSPGGQQVYYYGNGTFYNPSTETYGGSVTNPLGTAGVNLGYSVTVMSPDATYAATPGVPNTGAGGEALATWITLALSLAIAASGISYLIVTRKHADSLGAIKSSA